MNIWWLAIDRDYTSYEELKYRKVVAQGWPKLGDLSLLLPLVINNYKNEFLETVNALNKLAYGEEGHASKVMWSLFSMKKGDLVVGIEGTTVRGICQVNLDANESYQLQSPNAFNYAQTISSGVKWVDWNESILGTPPTAPAKSVQGVAGLHKEYNRVLEAWEKCTI
ncbi:hypothetical protein F1K70_24760 [Vibrio parahaemolyticus]|nr:hypothetical protein [Vibrio parahaemolyticus]EGQ7886399.1 hypothetical protein [Vibrio parahaemolyticus]EGQ9373567.1 hypothetical protein [Vibrio parahaemolyticus]EGQ9423415.1 hypothetical protein [Vibrio parahaemolyticus]EGQ9428308.1 hypothetical protein [Vibrio parahaemolyticus]